MIGTHDSLSSLLDGFVNFTSMSSLLAFCKQRLGTRWNKCNSDKLCILSFANIQVSFAFWLRPINLADQTFVRIRVKLLSSITSKTLAYSIKTSLVVRRFSLRVVQTLVNRRDSLVSLFFHSLSLRQLAHDLVSWI